MSESRFKYLTDNVKKYESNAKQIEMVEVIKNCIRAYDNVYDRISEDERTQFFDQIGLLFLVIQAQNDSSFSLINLINNKFKLLDSQVDILTRIDAEIRKLDGAGAG